MIHHPRHVKSFLAIVGRNPPGAGIRLPEPLSALEHDVFDAVDVRVHSFGSSTATLDPPPYLAAPAWIKGRPFALASSLGLETFDARGRRPDAALRNLDGKWSLLMARADGSLLAATDLFGSGSVFYGVSDGCLYLSSHLGLLLGALPTIPIYDQECLASLLVARRSLDDRTPWTGIARLRQGCYLEVALAGEEAPRWSVREYAAIAEVLAGPPRGDDQTALVEEYDTLLRQSLRRERYAGRVALMLSGGHDSRALALALLEEAGAAFTAVTFGSPGTGDRLGATALARRLKIPQVCVPYDAWDFSSYANRIASLNGGVTSLEFSYQLPGYESASANFDIALVGHLGNRLTTAVSSPSTPPEQRWARITSSWGRPNPLVERFYPEECSRLFALYRADFERMADLPVHQRSLVRLPFGTIWQSLNFDTAESYLEISYPFYYRPLLSFVYNLPSELFPATGLFDVWSRRADQAVSRRLGVAPAPDRLADRAGGATSGEGSRTQRRLVVVLDWPERVRRSADWLFATIDQCCDDARLRELCRASLRSHLDRDGTFVPVVLMGLSPPLAGDLLRPSAQRFGGWSEVRRRAGARLQKLWATTSRLGG